jgi:hypothetical protein
MGSVQQTIWHGPRTDNRYTFFNGRPLVFDGNSSFHKHDLEDLIASENFSVQGHDKDFDEYNDAFEAGVKARIESEKAANPKGPPKAKAPAAPAAEGK